MKFSKIFSVSIFAAIMLVSCKKENQQEKDSFSTNLPNFGNVDVNKVFSPQDSQVENEPFIKSFLDQYYDNVWEKGNLWGGILVAKGDKFLLEKYRGFAQDHEQSPINQNTPMHVASISKTLTAMAVL